MSGRLTLRALGLGALLLLFVNPAVGHLGGPSRVAPLVLLDASLSMAGQWRSALDTVRTLGQGGVVWRFGDVVTPFDTTAPVDGASRVGPALAAAAAHGGYIVIVTDGEVTDLQEVPADLRKRARVIVVPRRPLRDGFVSALEAPRRVSPGDTVRIKVAYGVAGPRGSRGMEPRGRLVVEEAGRRLAGVPVLVPDSGVVTTDLLVPAAAFPSPGFHVLTVRLDGFADSEPRDDARRLVIEVSAQPSAVVLAAPPDWESRFLAKVLEDVARVPVRIYDQTEAGGGGGGQWREGRTLAPAALAAVMRDVQAARLVALVGDPQRLTTFHTRSGTATLTWSTVGAATGGGDWYVGAPPTSPLEGDLAGISWDSLPPVSAGGIARADTTQVPVLSARLGRRGNPMPIVLLQEGEGGGGRGRRVTMAATGLWRWAFRGGAAEQAYRGLIAALANWLLERGAGAEDRVLPVSREVPNGLPLRWRWSAGPRVAPPTAGVPIVLTEVHGIAHTDTLRFDAAGEAQVRMPPGEYRYEIDGARGGGGGGVVVVETYSDEWRPTVPALASQPGLAVPATAARDWRDRWWLFVVAILAFTGEWVWRRRQGLP